MDNYIVQNKKKRKRKALIVLLVLFLIALLGGGIFWHQKRAQEAEANANAESAVKLQKNQSWKYYRINEIIGNEVKAVEIEEDGKEIGEEKIFLIPVGTEVITSIQSVTTFTRLSAGKTIHCLMQETDDAASSEIVKIWIVEDE
ncbi:MAG: hypothetical protein K5641_00385 [Lachnospiraceae bacterium]|nr:hypothetical protein [Lachnospiraceae bacterium]